MSDVTIIGPGNEVLYNREIAPNEDAHVHIYFSVENKKPSLDRLKAGDEGIDVSRWQLAIDWKAVAAPKSFAYMRATTGAQNDSTFAVNWSGAKAAAVLRGAYHYYIADAPPEPQARAALAALKADGGELPLCLDVEPRSGEVIADRLAVTRNLKKWLDLCETELGYKPIIYCNRYSWEVMTVSPEWASEYAFWIARYSNIPPAPASWPRHVKAVKLWQYSNSGVVNGIAGPVDLDRAL